MKYFVLLLVLIGFLGTFMLVETAFAQQTEKDNNESDQFLPPPSIFYGSVKEPIEISLHQSVNIKDPKTQILFSKIIEDSRCPSDVTCVWQGRVSVQLNVTTENDSKQIVLSLENKTAPINNDYYLMLLDVKPYPTSQNPIQEKDYKVTIYLERIGPNQSPLQQFRSGIPINEIQCKEGLELILRSSGGFPACVTPETKQKLVERGWAKLVTWSH